VKKYQTDKAERETGSVESMEAVNPVELAVVAEPEFQYGAEAFEAHQQETTKVMATDKATKKEPVKNGKSR
jgi:plasmid segregation protein ParM